MNKNVIGVLRGSDGDHYETSLRRGGEVIAHIHENLKDKWQVFDILIDRDGVWHFGGVPIQPAEIGQKVDVVWNASHHSLSNILESLLVPTVGTTSFAGALGESRAMLERHMKEIGVKMPRHLLFPAYQPDFDGPGEKYAIRKAKEVFEKFGAPWVVRSFAPNRNMGIHLAKTYPELVSAIADGVHQGQSILVEEFLFGKIATTHSVAGFRGDDIYTFPPANLLQNEKEMLLEHTRNIFRHLGVRDYLQLGFVLTPRRGIYLTHVNFTPDLKEGSHFHEACQSVGAHMHQVLEHILESNL